MLFVRSYFASAIVLLLCLLGSASCSFAQAPGDTPNAGISQAELQQLAAEAADNRTAALEPNPNSGLKGNLNFLKLLFDGGTLMIPIALMSLLVVAIALERWIALRRAKLFPRGLRREIRRASDSTESASPQILFQQTQQYPSVAASVLQDLLQKVGRPIPEMESAVSDGAQREADDLYSNVRWLTLAAAVTPLIGLLGTVWGMIIAFYNTTKLGAGTNKAEFLAEGIYVALVTTLGGLAVAIPAAIFAHYFEGKIHKVLALIEFELKRLIPRFEALEGRARFDVNARNLVRRDTENAAASTGARKSGKSASPPIPPPPPVRSSLQ